MSSRGEKQDVSEAGSSTIFLVGPTASGKTSVALVLAQRLRAEIVSADSMQVYRGMDIGTAKPSSEELAGVPHHLIDVADVGERFDVARYVALAGAAIEDIHRRGKIALVVGGTGLYVRALAEGLNEAPPADPALRAELEAMGIERVLEELRKVDPEAADRIGPHNFRRLVRALEICRVSGRKSSELQREWNRDASPLMHGLDRNRADLYARCNSRVEEMFRAGLVEEVRFLATRGLAENTTARQALGYKEVLVHLRNEQSLKETIEEVKTRTRHFAKRQLTWFRHQARVNWCTVGAIDSPEQIASRLEASIAV